MKIGIIGVGYWGPNLVRNLVALKQNVVVFDVVSARMDAMVAQYPDCCSKANSLGDILNDTSIDAVVIAVPAYSHCDLVVQALTANKHVFVEKPLCQTIEESATIEKSSNQSKILMTGHITSFSPGIEALKKVVDDGTIGLLQALSLSRTHCGPIYKMTDVLTEVAAHDVAIALMLRSDLPDTVIANGHSRLAGNTIDSAQLMLEWSDGLHAYIDVQWCCALRKRTVLAEGSLGSLFFNLSDGLEHLEYYDQRSIFETLRNGGSQKDVARCTYPKVDIPVIPGEPLLSELTEFVQCCTEGRKPRTGFDFSQKVVRILVAAGISLNNGSEKVRTT